MPLNRIIASFTLIFFGLSAAFAEQTASRVNATHYDLINCQNNYCYWSSIVNKDVLVKNENGTLIAATTNECVTTHNNGKYPHRYTCRSSEIEKAQYVAFCSTRFPSFAFKDDENKWQRTRLSISEGNARSVDNIITNYLRICHHYMRGRESLDIIGAKFGYRNRIESLGANTQDTVQSILDMAE
jgi:hypothetical protein